MKDFLYIDLKELEKKKLTLNQYLALLKIEGIEIPYDPDDNAIKSLVSTGMIRLSVDTDKNGMGVISYKLTEKAVFDNDSEDLFSIFLDLYPKHTGGSDSRWLCPINTTSILGKELQAKWRKVTKGNKQLQKLIIDCLKAEIAERKRTNNLQYMRQAIVWLNKAEWEKWTNKLTATTNPFEKII